MTKVRIDRLVVDLGLVASRQKAQSLIMAGRVLVNETAVTKAGTPVDTEASIRIKEDLPFVSRGGIKLNGALDDLNVSVRDRIILDVGASTGGFTDCCLQRGARLVYAIDVGTNQLDYALRTHPQVRSFEQTNARDLNPSMFDLRPELAVIDVSFISITKILDAVLRCLSPGGEIVAMVKPQFEVGPERVGRGGVVRNDADRLDAVQTVIRCGASMGLVCAGTSESCIAGPKGNREIFVHLVAPENPSC